MFKWMMLLAVSAVTLAGCAANQKACGSDGAKMCPASVYRHVVVFRYKDDATDQQIQRINEAFAALPDKIDSIRGFEWGTNVSPENLADGFTHVYLVTFDDKAGLEEYLPHPAHKAFVKKLKPILDKAFVVDYVGKPTCK